MSNWERLNRNVRKELNLDLARRRPHAAGCDSFGSFDLEELDGRRPPRARWAWHSVAVRRVKKKV